MHRLAVFVSAFSTTRFLYSALYISVTETFHRVLQMQIMIITLLENFEFALPPQDERTKIHRKPTAVMMPMAKGHKGAWMGLLVKPVDSD
jgi:hypothetical protein